MEVRILVPSKFSAKVLYNKIKETKTKASFDYNYESKSSESEGSNSTNSSSDSESIKFSPRLSKIKKETYSPPHLRKRKRRNTNTAENFDEEKIIIVANEYIPKGTQISTSVAGVIQIVHLNGTESISPLSKDDIRYHFDGFEKVLTNTDTEETGVEIEKVLATNWIRFLEPCTKEQDSQVNTIGKLHSSENNKAPYIEFIKDVSPGTRINTYFEIPEENCKTENSDNKMSELRYSIDEAPLDLSGTINTNSEDSKIHPQNKRKTQNLTPFLIRNVLNEKSKGSLSSLLSETETRNNEKELNEDLGLHVHSPENSNSSSDSSSTIQMHSPERKFLNNNNKDIKEKSNANLNPFSFNPSFPSGLPQFQGNLSRNPSGPATAILRPILRTRGRERSLLPCDVCGKAFDRPSLLKRHMRTHTGEKPHVCDVCSKGFSTSSSLNTHRRIHSGEKPHQCPICGKRFTASSNLYYHRMTHNKEKPHKCGLCGKSFPTPGDLKSHQYVHSGSWPYNCPVCHRGFSKQTNLRNHLLLHSGDKPHTCSSCGKKFALACNLRAHLRTHEEELTISCINCKRSFLTSQNIVKNGFCRPCTTLHGKDNTSDTATISETLSKDSSPELPTQNIYGINPHHHQPFPRPQVNNPNNEMNQSALSSLFNQTGLFPRVIPGSFHGIPQVQPIANSIMRQPMNQLLEQLVEWNWRCAKETGSLSAGIMHQMIAAQLMSNSVNSQSLQATSPNASNSMMLNEFFDLNRGPGGGTAFPLSFPGISPSPQSQLSLLRNSKK